MGLTTTIVRRSILQRPGRTLFSILGIAVGIATVVGVYTLDHNTIVGLSKKPDMHWRPAIEVNPGRKIENAREKLKDLEGVSEVCRIFQNDVVVTVEGLAPRAVPDSAMGMGGGRGGAAGGERVPRARLFAVEAGPISDFDTWRVLEGRSLHPNTDEREVLIGEKIAARWGVGPGDEVQLARPRRAARRDCIDGELRTIRAVGDEIPDQVPFTVVGILAREKLGWYARGEVVVVDYEEGLDLFEGAHVSNRYWVQHDPATDIETVRSGLSDSFSFDFNKSAIVGQAADERAFRNGVRMAGLLALVLGLYVIFHTLSMSLLERVKEVGIMHALGATRDKIARVFLSEAVVIAGIGGILGLVGGLALARLLMRFGISTVGMGKGRHIVGFEVPWDAVLALTGMGFLIALAGSIFPLLRAKTADTVAALRGEEALKKGGASRGFNAFAALLVLGILPALYFVIVPVVGDHQGTLVGVVLGAVAVMALLLVVPLLVPALLAWVCEKLTIPFEARWPFAGRMAARGMRDARTRVAVSVSAVALVTAAFVGLKGMTNSITGEVEVWSESSFYDKVYFWDLPDVSVAELSEACRDHPDVVGLEVGSTRKHGSFLLLGMSMDDLTGYGPLSQDTRLANRMENQHGIIISKRLANHDGYEIGDAIPITIGGGQVQDFRVMAITDDYGYFPYPDERMYGVVSDTHMQRYFCQDIETADTVALRIEDGGNPDAAYAVVRELYGSLDGISSITGDELRGFHIRDIEIDFILFDVILGLTAVLAVLGVLNGMLLSALERSKEIGVLKALGVSRAQVAGMVMLESVVIGTLGGVIGLTLGAVLTPLIVTALEQLSGLPLPIRSAGPFLFYCLFGAAVLTVVAGLYPVWRMNRMDAVRAVRTG